MKNLHNLINSDYLGQKLLIYIINQMSLPPLVPPYNFYLLTVFLNIISGIFIFYRYLQKRYTTYLYVTFCWIFVGLFYFFNVLGYLFWNIYLMIGGTYLWIIVAYSLILLTDSISRVGRDPKKLVLVSASSAILVYTSLQPNSITTFLLENGDYGWDWQGDFKVSFMFLSIILMLLLTYY